MYFPIQYYPFPSNIVLFLPVLSFSFEYYPFPSNIIGFRPIIPKSPSFYTPILLDSFSPPSRSWRVHILNSRFIVVLKEPVCLLDATWSGSCLIVGNFPPFFPFWPRFSLGTFSDVPITSNFLPCSEWINYPMWSFLHYLNLSSLNSPIFKYWSIKVI